MPHLAIYHYAKQSRQYLNCNKMQTLFGQTYENFPWSTLRLYLCTIQVQLSIQLGYSCIFYSCYLLPHFPFLHFPPLHFCPYRIFHSWISVVQSKLLDLLISHPSSDLCTGWRLMNALNTNSSHLPTKYSQPTWLSTHTQSYLCSVYM